MQDSTHTAEQLEAAREFDEILGDFYPLTSYSSPESDTIAGDTSPLFSDAGDDFLTGPGGTPSLDFFGTSPFDTPYNDFLETPLFQDEPLFGDDFMFGNTDISMMDSSPPKLSETAPTLYTMSPTSPAVDFINPTATSLYPSSNNPPKPRYYDKLSSVPTGTRKNITPDTMVPLDAPTQSRQYRAPSATSRKEVPTSFARKRTRAQAFADDEDELELGDLPLNATDAQQIEYKRRQNTIAARKSRKRKLEYQQTLESELAELKMQVEQWRVRAEIYEGVLKSSGLGAAVLPTH
nr:TGA4 [Flammulina filiformis]